ncbi:hypothetical protein [Arthrobacter sp. KNU40]|uniref:hypothetical protein n=1 Tax=Arthrobacter sp. KNU40 TaxID=3447965 RepID=UPI003F5EB14B
MSVEKFIALPHVDRMVLIKSMLEQARNVSLSYGDVYEHNPLDVAAKDNSPQEIMKQIQFEAQMIYNQGVTNQADDLRLNKDTAKKAMSGMFYETSGKTSMLFKQSLDVVNNTQQRGPIKDRYGDIQEIGTPQTLVDQNGKTIEYRTIKFTNLSTHPHTARVVFTPLGKDTGIWQIYDSDE